MNILLSAYSCNPNKGSEAGVGWNWLFELSKQNRIFLLFYAGQGQIEALKAAIKDLPQKENIKLYPISVNRVFRNKFYRIRYEVWQIKAFFLARRLVKIEKIDLIHQVTIAAWWFTGYFWKMSIPFVLGPILGGQVIKYKALGLLKTRYKIYEITRTILLFIAKYIFINSIISIKKADLVLAGNNETLKMLSRIRKNKPLLLFNTTCIRNYNLISYSKRDNCKCINLLWSGLLIHRKNFGFLIKCLESLPSHIEWNLKVVGGGKLLYYWQNEVVRKNLSKNIQFIGNVEYNDMQKYYEWSDIFLFPSLREGAPTVILEAMSFGIPVIAFNQNGADVMLDDNSGILIPVKNPKQMVDDFRNAIVALASDKALRVKIGTAAQHRVRDHFTLLSHGKKMVEYYNQYVIKNNIQAQ